MINQLRPGGKDVQMFPVMVSIAEGYYESGNAFASELAELGYNVATDCGYWQS